MIRFVLLVLSARFVLSTLFVGIYWLAFWDRTGMGKRSREMEGIVFFPFGSLVATVVWNGMELRILGLARILVYPFASFRSLAPISVMGEQMLVQFFLFSLSLVGH